MNKSEQFREHAADCLRLAASAQDQQAHALLMHMADAWIRLAAATPSGSRAACGGATWGEMPEQNGSD